MSRSPFCGDYNVTYLDSLGTTSVVESPNRLVNEFYANAQNQYQRSQQYVEFCPDPSVTCRELPHKQLEWKWALVDQCSFKPEICHPELNKSVVIDTGLISPDRHLGLNSPEADRIQYRKVTTCPVLNDAKYVSDWKNISATTKSPAKRVVDAYYGPNPISDRNATYSCSEWDTTNPYQLDVQWTTAADTTGTTSDFIPVPELARMDGDTILFFLSFPKVYESPVSDPWFSANQATGYPTHDDINVINRTVYARERPVTTLACVEQRQICIDNDHSSAIPDSQRRTPLVGSLQTSYNADALNLTARQVATATRVFNAAEDASIYMVTSALAQRDLPLLARHEIQGLLGLPLPDDQWLREVEYWNKIAMTHLQRSVLGYSSGQFAADTSYINTTLSPWNHWLCQNQIIRGTKYQSFNLFAMIMVLVFGSLIIIAGYTIEDSVALWRRRDKIGDTGTVRRDMWAMDEMLQMLSVIFSLGGRTTWSHSSNGIPVAGPGQLMNVKDLDVRSSNDQELREKELRHVTTNHSSRTALWRPHPMDSSTSTIPPRSARNRNESNSNNAFVFSTTEVLEPTTSNTEDTHKHSEIHMYRPSRARGTPEIHTAYNIDWHRPPWPPDVWGEAPRSPPSTPLQRQDSWYEYGRAY